MNDDNVPLRSPRYRKPPAEHQFPKGKSGNPRGRPPKRERAPLPSQIIEDILTDAQQPVRIKVRGKLTNLSTIEAILMMIRSKALGGNMPAARFYYATWERSVRDFYNAHKRELEMFEAFKKSAYYSVGPEPSNETKALLNRTLRSVRKSTGSK